MMSFKLWWLSNKCMNGIHKNWDYAKQTWMIEI